jgi:hypothetical protein
MIIAPATNAQPFRLRKPFFSGDRKSLAFRKPVTGGVQIDAGKNTY